MRELRRPGAGGVSAVSVTVGVHVHAEPRRLAATLAALRQPARHVPEVIVLPDGPDAATRAALEPLGLPVHGTDEPRGAPACFNRLAAATDARVVVLLESGAVPAAGALDLLVDALVSDPGIGLAGPSTNLAWNEQARRRPAAALVDLAPLHSLSDFCYAVRREVLDAIGGADEGFGLGPCWEMEYNARAARAGFRGVWVTAAYVERARFTARRRREETRLFDASRRRYQDAVCGLRLRGERPGYEPHCRGEDCEHFAPRELIELARPLPRREDLDRGARPKPEPAVPRAARPLVSCVMPTRDRADLALHAVDLFLRQDYEPRELIVVDDGDDGLAERLPDDPRVRYLRARPGESIGAKRNRACAEARGDFVAQWDDDDWYAPTRLSAQLAPLIDGRADVTGLRTPVFFEVEPWRFWAVDDALHRRLFVGDVHGGTLVFARRVWESMAQYPAASLAEDAAFLTRARARGARLARVEGDGLFAYMRHSGNAWRFACGEYLDPSGWRPVEEPALPPADRDFYASRSAAAGPAPAGPLVSCIMPTADRRQWVARSIEYFRRQDHPNRELIVVDDGADRVADLIPPDPRVRYVPLDAPMVLGEKRNHACALARGELIVHWDDDDWQASRRLRYQAEQLEAHEAELCGTTRVLYFDPRARRAWLYEHPGAGGAWVAGNALCYRRSLWERHPFAAARVGEDSRFVASAAGGRALALADHLFFAGTVHSGNTSPKQTAGAWWRERPVAEAEALLGADWPD
jgi:glycosyltransferase involved in cell wall biosynthesis